MAATFSHLLGWGILCTYSNDMRCGMASCNTLSRKCHPHTQNLLTRKSTAELRHYTNLEAIRMALSKKMDCILEQLVTTNLTILMNTNGYMNH